MQRYPSEHVHGHSSHFQNFRRIGVKLGTNILRYNTLPCFEKFESAATGRLFVGMAIFINVDKQRLLMHKSHPQIAINIANTEVSFPWYQNQTFENTGGYCNEVYLCQVSGGSDENCGNASCVRQHHGATPDTF